MSSILSSKPLIIFELANNHMGSVEHGLRVIREFGALIAEFDRFRFAFKLQYRDLATFIHPAYQGRSDIRHVKRFLETELSDADFRRLVAEIGAQGFVSVCTPFDEASVDTLEAHAIDVIKIASCSFGDWPLLERIAASDRPIVASTAGAILEDIDRVVSFFEHRNKALALMHCVGEYPTPREHFNLNQIDLLRQRYPALPVGYSTHEDPAEELAIQIAVAKGARLFEKHIGVPTAEWPLNAYSANVDQVRAWLQAANEAFELCGEAGIRATAGAGELGSLNALRRGVYVKRDIPAGQTIGRDDVYFAFPPQDGQLLANDWSKYSRFRSDKALAVDAPVMKAEVQTEHLRQSIQSAVDAVKKLLAKGHIVVPGKSDLEISHHYGMPKFHEFGLVMITVVNREYCKKLLVMLPGQTHPEQHHIKKEETFLILHGEIEIALDGVPATYRSGDVVTVARGVRHKFHSKHGVVLEELSSSHYPDDSYYTDPAIHQNTNRKTLLTYWM